MKKILVPLDPSEFSKAAVHQACQIAQTFGSKVVGIAIIDLEGIDAELRKPFRMDTVELQRSCGIEMVKVSREKLDEVVNQFQETCEKYSVPFNIINTHGQPAVCIVDESRFHDLIVMGTRNHLRFISDLDDDYVLENVIRNTCSPVLLVPGGEILPFHRVAVAYDGSPPATRAMQYFARLAVHWQPEIRIITSMNEEKGKPLVSSAKKYFEDHGYQKVTAELMDRSISQIYEDISCDWADLWVIGASSKSFVEKVLFGSFPKKLIQDGQIPLFITP